MRRSRAAALLTGDYLDRNIQIQYAASVPDGTAAVVVVTYTVGANILSRLEDTFILTAGTAAAATAFGAILAQGLIIDTNYSVAGVVSKISTPRNLSLTSGQTLQLLVQNLSGAADFIQMVARVREIDL